MIQNQISFSPKKVFFTSDTHFFHSRVILHAHRPFADVDEMNETLIRNWNKAVPKDGVVFHLGDFCFGGADLWGQILDRLKGTIYLVAGNHDKELLNNPIMQRFAGVDCQMHVVVGGQSLILNHFPLLVHGGNSKTWQLFGHIHTNPVKNHVLAEEKMALLAPTQYDVGVDNNDFTPVSFERIQEIIAWQTETGKRFQSWAELKIVDTF